MLPLRSNDRNAQAAAQHPEDRRTAVLGRPCQAGFSAHAKCCGTASGKVGSDPAFAVWVARMAALANPDVIPLLKGVKIYSLDEGHVTSKHLKDLLVEAEREAKAISVGSKASAAQRRARVNGWVI